MLIGYLVLIFLILRISNVYLVWLIIEISFLFFFLYNILYERKNIGLIIYFFFQSVVSLLLFISIRLGLSHLLFFLLIAKLGLFPFFYWIVVVSIKIGIIGNIFVLSLQKVSVFRMFWLLFDYSFVLLYFFVYLSIFFVILSLLLVRDIWLLMVYSSIGNTGIILLRVYGSNYLIIVFLYLLVILFIIFLIKNINSFSEFLLLVFLFLVIPPFILFLIKFYIVYSLDFSLKLRFFLVFFDVFVLLYYFSLIFIKFILFESGILIYIINLFMLLLLLLLRSCVAMIVFH